MKVAVSLNQTIPISSMDKCATSSPKGFSWAG